MGSESSKGRPEVLKKILSLLFVVSLAACASKLIKDPAPASIDTGFQRVETMVCERHDIGENGCALKEGNLKNEELWIYGVLQGEITIIGANCGVNKVMNYTWNEKDPWVKLKLDELIGADKIADDCVLSIYQKVNFPGSDQTTFPIRGMEGTVTLGTCPAGVDCSAVFYVEQLKHHDHIPEWLPITAKSGSYIVQGCGQVVVPVTKFNAPLKLDLMKLWPGGYPTDPKKGCLFIMGVKGDDGTLQKIYHKTWIYNDGNIKMAEPSVTFDGSKVSFVGDQYASLTIVGSKAVNAHSGSYNPNAIGDYLRFYTVQGRSIVVFVKDGKITWIK